MGKCEDSTKELLKEIMEASWKLSSACHGAELLDGFPLVKSELALDAKRGLTEAAAEVSTLLRMLSNRSVIDRAEVLALEDGIYERVQAKLDAKLARAVGGR